MIFSNVLTVFCIISIAEHSNGLKLSSYVDARNAILEAESKYTIANQIVLNAKEQKVNEIFMKYKQDELVRGFKNEDINAPGMHIFKAKNLIENSKVFKFLKNMPKGAVLHLHTTASVSSAWVVQNISYTPGLLRCKTRYGFNIFTFRRNYTFHDCVSNYFNINEERLKASSAAAYDREFEKSFNLWTPTPEVEYPTQERVWKKFQNMFNALLDVQRYVPVFRNYIYRMLTELYDDHVMYAELRMVFEELYDKRGRIYSVERALQEFINVLELFKQKHPNFLGVKVIYSTFRRSDENIRRDMKIFKKLQEKYSNLVIGFDFVGQEDKGKSLFNLLNFISSDFSNPVQFFLHAGESNYFGSSTDNNLLDAVLLNTTRIGHGYALMKHPVIYNAVKQRNIPVEVSPISNQVLNLVKDLRNHPASMFIAHSVPFVICNDDPGFWNVQGLSYDFYYAVMSLAPNNAGLKLLKSLVRNSLEFSVLEKTEYIKAFKNLNRDWDNFIDSVLNSTLEE